MKLMIYYDNDIQWNPGSRLFEVSIILSFGYQEFRLFDIFCLLRIWIEIWE